jgi:hypothetical protein
MKRKYVTIVLMAVVILTTIAAGWNTLTGAPNPPAPMSSLSQKAVLKQAKKDAKRYRKEGFRTFVGGLPLERQIENAWMKTIAEDAAGLNEYVVANARVIGGNTSGAKMQAIHQAKVEMAGLISSNIASLIESSTTNSELSQQEAASLSKALQASKELITADFGRVSVEIEIYRELPNLNVEVIACLAYSSRQALEIAKKNILQKMEDGTEVLHQKLDKIMGLDKFAPQTNTNLKVEDD